LTDAEDHAEALSTGSSIDELFEWVMEPEDNEQQSLWHAESIACG